MGTLPSLSPHIDTTPPEPTLPGTTSPERTPPAKPRTTSWRGGRLMRAAVGLVGFVVASLMLGIVAPSTASARSSCGDQGCVDELSIDGLIDDIVADFITESVRRANRAGDVVAVVIQIDSLGTAISDERLNRLAGVIADSPVPVSVWVGASGSRVRGGAAELALVADSTGIAPGAHIGEIGEQRLDPTRFPDVAARTSLLAERSYTGEKAVEAGVVDRFDPTLVDHIGNLEAVDSKVVTVDGKQQRQPIQRVRLSKLPLPLQIMHTAASPSVAYLLLVIGAALLLFEFFTAGIGVAGVVGAGFLLLGGYGIAELPHRSWALALFVLSFVAFGIDMQTGLARLWTWIGFAAFTVSSLFLLSEFPATWLSIIAGLVGIGAVVFRGMPSMNRARFGTPYIGREWLEGETGEITEALSPIGTVRLRGVDWAARAAQGYEGAVGDPVQVVGSDRMLVEVSSVDDSGDAAPGEANKS